MQKIFKHKIAASVLFMGILFVSGSAWALAKKHDKKNARVVLNPIVSSAINNIENINSSNNSVQPSSTQQLTQSQTQSPTQQQSKYPWHKNVSTTYFWAGEEAGKDNKNISNLPSAWDDQWVKHFGGIDDPKKRNGFVVATFFPKENSFYFALPYNDFDNDGKRKKEVNNIIPWASSKKWGSEESMLKNQWIRITKGGKTAYAQWEDVGPFGENDSAYVFGSAAPKSNTNERAGLDVSPSVKEYLNLSDIDKTDWQFVDAAQVPDGPWKKTITTSQIFWQ